MPSALPRAPICLWFWAFFTLPPAVGMWVIYYFSTFSNFYLGNEGSYEKCIQETFLLEIGQRFWKHFFFQKIFFYFQSFLAQNGCIVRKIYKRPFLHKICQRIRKKIFFFFAKKWFFKKRTETYFKKCWWIQ